jgi:hypothetical protein
MMGGKGLIRRNIYHLLISIFLIAMLIVIVSANNNVQKCIVVINNASYSKLNKTFGPLWVSQLEESNPGALLLGSSNLSALKALLITDACYGGHNAQQIEDKITIGAIVIEIFIVFELIMFFYSIYGDLRRNGSAPKENK